MTRYIVSALASGLPSGTLVTASSPQNLPPINVITRSGTPSYPTQVSSDFGGLGGKSVVSGGGTSAQEFARHSIGASTQAGTVIAFRVPVLPSAAIDWFRRDNNSAAQVYALGLSPGNLLQLKTAAGGVVGSYATALNAGSWYIIEVDLIVGTTTSNGTLRARLYDIAGTTQLWSVAAEANTNTGTASLALARLPGDQATSTNVTVAYLSIIDNGTSVGSRSWIDRTLTVNAGADQTVEPWSTVTLGSSEVAALGTSAAGWTQIAGPAVALSSTASATPTFTAPPTLAGSTLTFRRTISDFDLPTAKTVFDDVTIVVRPPTETVWFNGVECPARTEIYRST